MNVLLTCASERTEYGNKKGREKEDAPKHTHKVEVVVFLRLQTRKCSILETLPKFPVE